MHREYIDLLKEGRCNKEVKSKQCTISPYLSHEFMHKILRKNQEIAYLSNFTLKNR